MKKLVTILAVSVLSITAFSQTITWAYLQWAASTNINQGQVFEAGAAVFADGLTNAVNSTTGEGITCELGYSSSNTNPSSSGWTWTSIAFNGDWGNNFYYQGTVSDIPAGSYYYTFRFKLGTDDYKYAGTNGLWDGTGSVSGTFTVNPAPAEITWAYLQWAAATTINSGQSFEAGATVFAEGLTNTVNSTTGEGMTADLGYSSTNNDPSSTGWTWTPVAFNSDWGNNFYFQGSVSGIPAGSYYYNFRFKLGSGDYKYAGTDGLWNGTSSVNGSLTVISTTDVSQITEINLISLIQNPVTNGVVRLKLNNPVSGIYSLRLFDSTGRLVLNKQFDDSASIFELHVGNQLKGMYHMQIISSESNITGFKVMIK
jgi:hypothetical protein